MAFKRISKNGFDGDKYKFETQGQELVGYFLGTQNITIKGKSVPRHSFKTATGVVSTLGSSNLNDGLTDAVQGAMTKITFEGETRTEKGNRFKKFTVEQDADDVLKEMPTAAASGKNGAVSGAPYSGSNVAAKAAELKGQLGKTVS